MVIKKRDVFISKTDVSDVNVGQVYLEKNNHSLAESFSETLVAELLDRRCYSLDSFYHPL